MAEEIRDVAHRSTVKKSKKTWRQQKPMSGTDEEKVVAGENQERTHVPAPLTGCEKDTLALLAETLDQIKERVKKHPVLTRDQKEDFLVDVEIVRVQIRKNVPNRDIILLFSTDLSQLNPAAI